MLIVPITEFVKLSLSVNFAAMGDVDGEHDQFSVENVADNAIVAYAVAPESAEIARKGFPPAARVVQGLDLSQLAPD